MSFRRKVKYFLVHSAGLTNREAADALSEGFISIDGSTVTENLEINSQSTITFKGRVLQSPPELIYFKFYKPRGFQSSLNTSVPNNLSAYFKGKQLTIAGRLDQDSEGLLLLSNDGKWVERICNPLFQKEKEYLVDLDQQPADEFLQKMRTGVRLGPSTSLPCECELISGNTIRIILKEGKNRQIRRMCHNLGFAVLKLKRVRIAEWQLGDLEPGAIKSFDPKETDF
jgi:23S rRNA pseudouridine2604 synthase